MSIDRNHMDKVARLESQVMKMTAERDTAIADLVQAQVAKAERNTLWRALRNAEQVIGNLMTARDTLQQEVNSRCPHLNIDALTIGEVRELAKLCGGSSGGSDGAWEVGKIYLIRTVTMIDTGRLVLVTPQELVLEDAAWIADTGRFADAVKKAEFSEVEPFPVGRVIVGRGSVIDAVQITVTAKSQK